MSNSNKELLKQISALNHTSNLIEKKMNQIVAEAQRWRIALEAIAEGRGGEAAEVARKALGGKGEG